LSNNTPVSNYYFSFQGLAQIALFGVLRQADRIYWALVCGVFRTLRTDHVLSIQR
jgi:hypothetical protein